MSTSAVSPVVDGGALTTEKQTYRSYIQTSTDAKGNTVVDKIKSQAEATAKDKDSGIAANWAKLEKEGWTLLSENEFIRYSVKSLEGFTALVPEEAQQVYIIQCGLNYIQNAKANAVMTALKEGAPEPTPLFNQDTIDLRTGVGENGEYSINEAPSRKSLSDVDKLLKMLDAMGVPADKRDAVLAALAATNAASEVTQEAQQ